jgi:hypothetical protein
VDVLDIYDARELVDGHAVRDVGGRTYQWPPTAAVELLAQLPDDGPITRSTVGWLEQDPARHVTVAFASAPAVLRALSFNGGDEDHLIVAARGDDSLRLAEDDVLRLAVAGYEHHLLGGRLDVWITYHA